MSRLSRLGERIVEVLGGITRGVHQQALGRAYEAGYEDGNDETPSGGYAESGLKTFGYRRASGRNVRNFGGLNYDTVLDTAWRVALLSPAAKRYLQLKRDYILGGGIHPKATSPAVQGIVDAFWADNRIDARSKQFVPQLHLLGEQCYPAFVRQTDGRVRLGYVDPIEIERVILHPDNALEKWAVALKQDVGATDEPWRVAFRQRRVYRIVRVQEPVAAIRCGHCGKMNQPERGKCYACGAPLAPAYAGVEMLASPHDGLRVDAGQATLEPWEAEMLAAFGLETYTGACFYFSRNELSNQPRGYSDLLQEADWIDQDETVLFDLAERENIAGYFVGDVTLTGADRDMVQERAGQIRARPPKKGSWNVHNDKEAWQMHAPDLKQAGTVETHRELQTHIWGGLGLPNAWYGHGDETNRATAQAQGDPTWRTMETDQAAIADLFLELLHFARDQAILAGALGREEMQAEIRLLMPEMTKKDLTQLAGALSAISVALGMAQDRGWITPRIAIDVWAKLMAEIDISIDPDQVIAEVERQAQEQEIGAGQAMNDWLAPAFAGAGAGAATAEEPVEAAR